MLVDNLVAFLYFWQGEHLFVWKRYQLLQIKRFDIVPTRELDATVYCDLSHRCLE
jgi:hypothetical protein